MLPRYLLASSLSAHQGVSHSRKILLILPAPVLSRLLTVSWGRLGEKRSWWWVFITPMGRVTITC